VSKKSPKNSLKECIFVNSALKMQCYVVKSPTDCFFGNFANWVVKLSKYDLLYGWITTGGHPNTSKCIRVYFVAEEFTTTVIMNIDTTSKTMVNAATYHSGVGLRAYFYASNSVIVDVVFLIITLVIIDRYYIHLRIKLEEKKEG